MSAGINGGVSPVFRQTVGPQIAAASLHFKMEKSLSAAAHTHGSSIPQNATATLLEDSTHPRCFGSPRSAGEQLWQLLGAARWRDVTLDLSQHFTGLLAMLIQKRG